MRKSLAFSLMLAVVAAAAPCFAEGWGTVTGKIVVKGDAPNPPELVAKGANVKDASVCAVNAVPDRSVVVGEKGELANCFVYLYQRRGTPDIHPDLEKSAEPKVVFDQKGCEFFPRSLVVRTDQKVNVISNDACGHNVHTYPLKNSPHNLLVGANDTKGVELEYPQSELLPMQVKCDIHPWMTAYWLVVDHPYAVVSNDKGEFKIENVPEGEHTFRIWHERVGYIERGLDVEIKDGETVDVGTIEVDADDLEG
ncbi:hypothetical protein [Rubinisphaera margarita]|uniref:hypothetical protein n=1 Tax=Rubinisphaera margarita TaxID=2909586 RepID=UPI001EE82847|nr:hypothetical protein [Rubinisphaera margarita]MCG6155028.1 hypothetical protein [Rubinisphaera margarita]